MSGEPAARPRPPSPHTSTCPTDAPLGVADAPIIAYPSYGLGYRIIVQKWDGAKWTYLRNPGSFSTSSYNSDDTQGTQAAQLALAASSTTVYLAHPSAGGSGKVRVIKNDGSGFTVCE